MLKLVINCDGYCVVNLTYGGRQQPHYVHRLVAEAFIQNPENKPTVNHINGVKHDNHIKNLEWATYSENNAHGWRILDSSERREKARIPHCEYFGKGHIMNSIGRKKMSDRKKKSLMCIETGKVYACALDASHDVAVSKQCITHACNGRCKTAGGYHWTYL